MNNRFTKKEEECPLQNGFCNQDHKDCNICIMEEEAYQQDMAMQEVYADIIRGQH